METPRRTDHPYKLHRTELGSDGAIVSRAPSLHRISCRATTRFSDSWMRKEVNNTLVIPTLSSPTVNLNSFTATASTPKYPFRRSEYACVAYGIPSSTFSSSPMRQDSGSCWNAPHNRLRTPKAVLFRWLGISSCRRSYKMLNPHCLCAILWISYPPFDEFDELCDFILAKLSHIKIALPLSGENFYRQVREFV